MSSIKLPLPLFLSPPILVNIEDDGGDLNNRIDAAEQSTSQFRSNDSGGAGDSSSIDQHLNTNLQKIREKIIITEYMCATSSKYFSFWNNVFMIPSILLTSTNAIINSFFGNTSDYGREIKIYNVVSNSTLTFLIAIQNYFKFGEKAEYFFNYKKKYAKIHNAINNEIIHQNNNSDMIIRYHNEYDQLDEGCMHEFPHTVVADAREKFEGYCLPTICNGIKVIRADLSIKEKRRKKKYTIPAVGHESKPIEQTPKMTPN